MTRPTADTEYDRRRSMHSAFALGLAALGAFGFAGPPTIAGTAQAATQNPPLPASTPPAAPASPPAPAKVPVPPASSSPGPDAPARAKPLVAFPHPLISEILWDPPRDKEGDADGDGLRSATGDEFIEVFNPHDRPINLRGYTLLDTRGWTERQAALNPRDDGDSGGDSGGNSGNKGRRGKKGNDANSTSSPPGGSRSGSSGAGVRFVFPDVELKPGQVAVVFNGFESKLPGMGAGGAGGEGRGVGASGPIGSDEDAPKAGHPRFHNALVFSMRMRTRFGSMRNEGDWVGLVSPEGNIVQGVKWGKSDESPAGGLQEEVPLSARGASVKRDGPGGKLVPIAELTGARARGVKFAPGLFPFDAAKAAPASPGANPDQKGR